MAQRVGQKVKLSSIDELLGVPSTEGTVDLDVMTIYPFENHPFKVVDDEKMDELVEDFNTIVRNKCVLRFCFLDINTTASGRGFTNAVRCFRTTCCRNLVYVQTSDCNFSAR